MSLKKNKPLETSSVPLKIYWFFRSMWRVFRWLMEFGLPVYVFTAVICFALISLSIENKKISLPFIGEISSETTQLESDKIKRDGVQKTTDIMVLKEQLRSLEKSQDKNLAIAAGLAALLTFLGFKGYATISEASRTVSEAESRAEAVQDRLNKFFDHDYEINTRMSMNVMHGIVAREISVVLQKIAKASNQDPRKDLETRKAVDQGINYLDAVIAQGSEVNQQILIRAHGVKGNLLNIKGDFKEALIQSKAILKLTNNSDPSGWYNIACYSSQIANNLAADGKSATEIAEFANEAIDSLVHAGKSDSSFKRLAQNEADLEWLRKNRSAEFLAATK